MTVGQELRGYATQVRRGGERVAPRCRGWRELPLGGTAVGTGLNTPPGWRERSWPSWPGSPACR